MEAGEEMGGGEGEDEDEEEEEEEEEFNLPPIRDRAERSRAGMIPIFAFFWGRGGGLLIRVRVRLFAWVRYFFSFSPPRERIKGVWEEA